MPDAQRSTRVAALVALAGTVLSGPIGVLVVGATHPQPAWRDAESFAQAYHVVQTLPYYAGFLLIGGFVALVAALHEGAAAPLRARTATAVAFSAAFAAMILLNYVLQTTVVPSLLRAGGDTDRAAAALLTMSNPRSVGWALEMWGYAVLGVATWLVAPAIGGEGRMRLTRAAFVANGPMSIVGALATAAWPGWVTTTVGLLAFAAWNVLMVAMLLGVMLGANGRASRFTPRTSAAATPRAATRPRGDAARGGQASERPARVS